MNLNLYIHRNLYARGFGFSIVREGPIIFNFWIWNRSGCFYFGRRSFREESAQNRALRAADDMVKHAAERMGEACQERDRLATVAAYETREG